MGGLRVGVQEQDRQEAQGLGRQLPGLELLKYWQPACRDRIITIFHFVVHLIQIIAISLKSMCLF